MPGDRCVKCCTQVSAVQWTVLRPGVPSAGAMQCCVTGCAVSPVRGPVRVPVPAVCQAAPVRGSPPSPGSPAAARGRGRRRKVCHWGTRLSPGITWGRRRRRVRPSAQPRPVRAAGAQQPAPGGGAARLGAAPLWEAHGAGTGWRPPRLAAQVSAPPEPLTLGTTVRAPAPVPSTGADRGAAPRDRGEGLRAETASWRGPDTGTEGSRTPDWAGCAPGPRPGTGLRPTGTGGSCRAG